MPSEITPPLQVVRTLSDHHILSPINPKYDDWFSSDLRRFTQIGQNKRVIFIFKTICVNFRKSDENQSSYFGLIGNKICGSDKEQPVPSVCVMILK